MLQKIGDFGDSEVCHHRCTFKLCGEVNSVKKTQL